MKHQRIPFTHCPNLYQAVCTGSTWLNFAKRAQFSKEYGTKDESKRSEGFVGGPLDKPRKKSRKENISVRTMATLDYDYPSICLGDIELDLVLGLECTFLAYTTYSSTPEKPRYRIVIPLSRQVRSNEYRLVVAWIAARIDHDGLDDCSYEVNRLMFYPSHQKGVKPFYLFEDGDFLDVDKILRPLRAIDDGVSKPPILSLAQKAALGAPKVTIGVDEFGEPTATVSRPGATQDDDTGLGIAIAMEPIDIDDAKVDDILNTIPVDACDYEAWVRVGMALCHQYRGSDDGFKRWDAWSKRDKARYMKCEMRSKWRSFGGDRERPITLRTLIKQHNEAKLRDRLKSSGPLHDLSAEMIAALKEDME